MLLQALGKKVIAAQAKRLDDAGLSVGELCNMRGRHITNDALCVDALKKRGIKSKRLHKTLPTIVTPAHRDNSLTR